MDEMDKQHKAEDNSVKPGGAVGENTEGRQSYKVIDVLGHFGGPIWLSPETIMKGMVPLIPQVFT